MHVPLMGAFVVILAVYAAMSRRIGMATCFMMMMMSMNMEARTGDARPDMPVHAKNRCPSELERDDEHDQQGNEATHFSDCTDSSTFSKHRIKRSSRTSRGINQWFPDHLLHTESQIVLQSFKFLT